MADNRDHRKPKTNPHGVPSFVKEDLTGNFEGEDLQRERRKRDTGERLDRLEDKHDKLSDAVTRIATKVGDVAEAHAELAGEIRGFVSTLKEEREDARKSKQLDHKYRNDLRLKVAGGVIALMTSGAVLHWCAGKL
jgi:hypothetical protein